MSSDTGEGAMVQTFPDPGIHTGVSLSDYLMLDAVSSSRLKDLGRSPAYCKYRMTASRGDTVATIVGSLVDALLLTPADVEGNFLKAGTCCATLKSGARCTSNGSLVLGREWYCKKKSHAPVTAGPPVARVLAEDDYDRALNIFHAIQAHPWWQDFQPTIDAAQDTLVWTDPNTGLLCKGRPDIKGGATLVDLKVCREAAQNLYPRKCAYLWHPHQLSHYATGYAELGVEITKRVILAAHPEEPHEVTAYVMHPLFNEWADGIVRDRMDAYADYASLNSWPPGVPEVELLPEWLMEDEVDTDDDTVDTED